MKKVSYSDLKISIKLSIMYVCFLCISLFGSLAIYTHISNRITVKKNIDLSMQSLYSLETSIYNIIENTSYHSRMILADDKVQQIRYDQNKAIYVVNQQKITKILGSISYSIPYIDSIYLLDNYGNIYGIDKLRMKALNIESIDQAPWYQAVKEKDGYYILTVDGCSIFSEKDQQKDISLIRMINSTTTMKPIGLLMINISREAFTNNYNEVADHYNPDILVLDENNRVISAKGNITLEAVKEAFPKGLYKQKDSTIIYSGKNKYLYSYIEFPEYNWKAVVSLPLQEMKEEIYEVIFMIVSIFSGIFLLMSFIVTTKIITNPIKVMTQSMKQMETGKFVRVNMKTGNDEIGQLKDYYNSMVDEIEKLINKIYEEQKFKRKAELKVLQEQVKPHFLYNTIDAMRYLAYSGKNSELCEALEAFASYYRTSLSKGREMISIRDEIGIVKDYLYLQKMRYGKIIQAEYEIEEGVLNYQVPKLILQPIVENAIYHGIKPKMKEGTITVRVYFKEEFIVFEVEDDGVGMGEEVLSELRSGKIESNMKSFGLRGTCERLRICYERNDLYKIESKKGIGTKITFRIPRETGGKRNDQTFDS